MDYRYHDEDKDYLKIYVPEGFYHLVRIDRWMHLLDDHDSATAKDSDIGRYVRARRVFFLWPDLADLYKR